MVQSAAQTVQGYLAELPADRRAIISKMRATVRRHLPKGYKETMGWGMISYGIPLSRYPDTYNGQPLCYAALAAQKNFNALYLMCVYGDPKRRAKLQQGFKDIGKKLDMGKSCIRFQKAEDLPLDVIGELIAGVSPEKYIEFYEKSREGRKK
ncbi:MAG TPA: DUF1801 domain-containing protein [Gemmatimonadales bacterium]|nr:DUF1801 domain-containing protein [Gemmatimonadales bacterium]